MSIHLFNLHHPAISGEQLLPSAGASATEIVLSESSRFLSTFRYDTECGFAPRRRQISIRGSRNFRYRYARHLPSISGNFAVTKHANVNFQLTCARKIWRRLREGWICGGISHGRDKLARSGFTSDLRLGYYCLNSPDQAGLL